MRATLVAGISTVKTNLRDFVTPSPGDTVTTAPQSVVEDPTRAELEPPIFKAADLQRRDAAVIGPTGAPNKAVTWRGSEPSEAGFTLRACPGEEDVPRASVAVREKVTGVAGVKVRAAVAEFPASSLADIRKTRGASTFATEKAPVVSAAPRDVTAGEPVKPAWSLSTQPVGPDSKV
jgi:hypothetical protein